MEPAVQDRALRLRGELGGRVAAGELGLLDELRAILEDNNSSVRRAAEKLAAR